MSVPSLFDRVREASRAVAEQARHVHIQHDQLAACAALLATTDEPREQDPRFQDLALYDREQSAALICCQDAVEFGSGWHPLLRKRPGLSGSLSIAAAMTEHLLAEPLTAEQLCQVDAAGCASLCEQPLDNGPVEELMGLFAEALRELGGLMLRHCTGRFLGLMDVAQGSAERLVHMLGALPAFHDVSRYHGFDVPFYKRAQLLAADLAATLRTPGEPPLFGDLDSLTLFADNLVPHVLRVEGLLAYEPALAAAVEAGELIPAGCDEEIEIRACGLQAVELLVNALREFGQPTT
ncbi:MAG: queuosine salvage family protein, partial [Chloroflexota bacterium]